MTDPSTGRQKTAQRPPPAGIDLTGFPVEELPAGTVLYRAHQVTRGAWWFTSSGEGRFDLTTPRGTCYVADTIPPAMRERLGRNFVGGGRAPVSVVDATVVTEVVAPGGRAANLEAPGVADYPVTGEMSTMSDYSVPQAWAAAFDTAGFAGIHYRGRFSHTYGVVCWALFDDAGTKPHGTGESVSGRHACELAGITVMPPPPSDPSTLRVIAPPT